nr:hypothetical protein CFP56_11754 [Quercus suber]
MDEQLDQVCLLGQTENNGLSLDFRKLNVSGSHCRTSLRGTHRMGVDQSICDRRDFRLQNVRGHDRKIQQRFAGYVEFPNHPSYR